MKAAIETLSDADAKSICAISDRYESETVAVAVVSVERYRSLRDISAARTSCDADEGMAGYFDVYDAARMVRVTIVRSSAPTHPSTWERVDGTTTVQTCTPALIEAHEAMFQAHASEGLRELIARVGGAIYDPDEGAS